MAKHLRFGLVSQKDIFFQESEVFQMPLCKPIRYCHVLFRDYKRSPVNPIKQTTLVQFFLISLTQSLISNIKTEACRV